MVKVSSPAKLILFGEHSVVYGKLGIAGAINLRTTAVAEEGKEGIFIDKKCFNQTHHFTAEEAVRAMKETEALRAAGKFDEIKKLGQDMNYLYLAMVGKIIGDNTKPVKVIVDSEIPPFSGGMGMSSSLFSAIGAALQLYYTGSLDLAKISEASYLGDVLAHGGTPSGIDNNTVVYGGFIQYEKPKVTPLKIGSSLPIVIGNSGEKAQTSVSVPHVRKQREENQERVDGVLDRMDCIARQGLNSIRNNDLEAIGSLMNQNQDCLREIDVSHPKLESLIKASLDAGALGAKLSGGGMGGIMIALCKDDESRKDVAKSIEKAGGSPIITELGVEGVRKEKIV